MFIGICPNITNGDMLMSGDAGTYKCGTSCVEGRWNNPQPKCKHMDP